MECYKNNPKNKSLKKFSIQEMYLFSKNRKKIKYVEILQ